MPVASGRYRFARVARGLHGVLVPGVPPAQPLYGLEGWLAAVWSGTKRDAELTRTPRVWAAYAADVNLRP